MQLFQKFNLLNFNSLTLTSFFFSSWNLPPPNPSFFTTPPPCFRARSLPACVRSTPGISSRLMPILLQGGATGVQFRDELSITAPHSRKRTNTALFFLLSRLPTMSLASVKHKSFLRWKKCGMHAERQMWAGFCLWGAGNLCPVKEDPLNCFLRQEL